jgi:hypothetical protein
LFALFAARVSAVKRILRSLLDTGTNAIGRIKYNRYKLLTFVLAALVIANALGITGWTVNTVIGLEINLPELAWAAGDGCEPECLDCERCVADKEGNTFCVNNCADPDEYCLENGSGGECGGCDPAEKPNDCHECNKKKWKLKCLKKRGECGVYSSCVGGKCVYTSIDKKCPKYPCEKCDEKYSCQLKDKKCRTLKNQQKRKNDTKLKYDLELSCDITDLIWKGKIGCGWEGEIGLEGEIRWWCDSKYQTYRNLKPACILETKNDLERTEYQKINIKFPVNINLELDIKKLLGADGFFKTIKEAASQIGNNIKTGGAHALSLLLDYVPSLGIALGEMLKQAIKDYGFECLDPCKILGF